MSLNGCDKAFPCQVSTAANLAQAAARAYELHKLGRLELSSGARCMEQLAIQSAAGALLPAGLLLYAGVVSSCLIGTTTQ
jgi:hypothetical protein